MMDRQTGKKRGGCICRTVVGGRGDVFRSLLVLRIGDWVCGWRRSCWRVAVSLQGGGSIANLPSVLYACCSMVAGVGYCSCIR